MNYDSDHHYRIAYGMMFIFLTPYFFYLSHNNFKSPVIVLFTLVIVGNEYSFSLPRKAMKIYEKVRFKSVIERINLIVRILSILFFSGSEIYYFDTNKYVLLFVSLSIIMIWDIVTRNQSFIIGSNSIIVGRRLIPHDSISKITYAKKNLVIVANGKSYKIYNWLLGNQRYELEKFKNALEDKV